MNDISLGIVATSDYNTNDTSAIEAITNLSNIINIGIVTNSDYNPNDTSAIKAVIDLSDGRYCLDQIACQFLASCLQEAGLQYRITGISNESGSLPSNSFKWSGIFRLLQTGQIDMVANVFSYTEARSKYFNYTRLFHDRKFLYLVKMEDVTLGNDALKLINGFSIEVWLSMLVTLMALITCMSLIRLISPIENMPNTNNHANSTSLWTKFIWRIKVISATFWDMMRFLLQQAEDPPSQTRISISYGAVFTFLSMLVVIMANLYQEEIYNQITTNARDAPFRSTDELVKLIRKGQLTMMVDNDGIAYITEVKNSNNPHFQMVREALKSNPLLVTHSVPKARELLESKDGGYVYVAKREDAIRYAFNSCEIAIIELENNPTFYGGFVFNMESSRLPFFRKIDKAVFQVHSRLEYLYLKLEMRYSRVCVKGQDISALSFSAVSGLMVVYAALIALAITIYFVEQITFWKFNKNRLGSNSKVLGKRVWQ